MSKINSRVKDALVKISELDTNKDLCILARGNKFEIYNKDVLLADNLSLRDLRSISTNCLIFKAVQLVDVSHLVAQGLIKSTDAYLKIEEDGARAFLHMIKKISFQNPVVATQDVGMVV